MWGVHTLYTSVCAVFTHLNTLACVPTHGVALLRACVENEAGPPGSWTEEQVIEGERERETLAYIWAKNAQEHGPSTQETQVEPETEQRTRICIYL